MGLGLASSAQVLPDCPPLMVDCVRTDHCITGAFGEVFLASWHGTNVAVKAMKHDTEAQEKIETEINMMKYVWPVALLWSIRLD